MDEHERAIVDRVLEELRQEFGGGPFAIDSPEESDREAPAVEALATNARLAVAVEHTYLESFPLQIRDGIRFNHALDDLEERITGRLPVGGYFQLGIDARSLDGVTRPIVDDVTAWIFGVAPTLGPRPGRRRPNVASGGPPDVPVQCVLVRNGEEPAGGHFMLARSIDMEALREDRVRRALQAVDSKCGKLEQARPSDHVPGLTVLVVETTDLSLANPWITAESMRAAIEQSNVPPPDRIALIDSVTDPWRFDWLKSGADWPLLDQIEEPP